MDPIKTSLSRIQLEALPPAARSILQKLEQSGLFRALVIESKGAQVLLDTAFGQLKGQSPQPLNKGDQILARIVQEQSQPTIKIEQVQLRQPVVTDKVLQQLTRLAANNPPSSAPSRPAGDSAAANYLPQIIKVLNHARQQTQILLGQKAYSIPPQPQLKPGDTLMLRLNDRQQAEIVRIDPQQVLKKALSELLPRLNAANERTPGLARLQKLVNAILQLKPADAARPTQTLQQIKSTLTEASATPVPGKATSSTSASAILSAKSLANSAASAAPAKASAGSTVAPATTKPDNSPAPPARANRNSSASTLASQRAIEQLLQQLARPLASAGRIDAAAVKQILTRLSLLPATVNPASPLSAPPSLPAQIQLLQQLISQSPQAFRDMLQQMLQAQQPAAGKVVIDEAQLQETANLLRHELQQQLEQTSTQLLVQKSTIKLNQEQQQPIQITLNIPLQFKEDDIQLKLKLKQRQQSEASQTQQWEIDLDFELPLLGLISTHLLLQDSTLSASFWAVRDSTRQLIDRHIHQFKQQLVKSGFELGQFHSFSGKPKRQESDDAAPALLQNLLDVKA